MNYVLFLFFSWLYEKCRHLIGDGKSGTLPVRVGAQIVIEGHGYPTLGERGSDLSSYNISANSDLQSGLVGESAWEETRGRTSFIVWTLSLVLPLPASWPTEGWVMWVMESNKVQILSVTTTLLYPVSVGSEVNHCSYWSWPCPTHLDHKWVYPTLITGSLPVDCAA